MSKVEDFLSPEQEQQVIAAIRTAEKSTSGEIRVHLEKHADKAILKRAAELFHWLKMDNTIQRNGVLIYVAVEDRNFAIYGDKGINEVVDEAFWNTTKNAIQQKFKENKFTEGLIDGVLLAGQQLQKYFPWKHGNSNELSDEISKG